MGKFRRTTEAAVFYVEKLRDGIDLGGDNTGIKFSTGADEGFRVCDVFRDRISRAFELGTFVAVGIGDGEQHTAEAGTAHLIIGRKIRTTEKRFAVRKQESGERPAALFRDKADRGLVARVHIGALVAVHFDGHEIVVDDFRDFGILVAFAVDDVAPVAPDSADVEKDGFVFGLGASKSGIVPFVPVNRLV